MDKKRLQTEIERNIHGLLSEVREHVVDYTVLTVRRQHPEVNREDLNKILEIVRTGVDDGFMTRIDRFMGKLDNSLAELSKEDASPLASSGPKKKGK